MKCIYCGKEAEEFLGENEVEENKQENKKGWLSKLFD
jgi:hypothetical protein